MVDVVRIQEDLLRFTSYPEPIDLSFNQYLLLGSATLLHVLTLIRSSIIPSTCRPAATTSGRDHARQRAWAAGDVYVRVTDG